MTDFEEKVHKIVSTILINIYKDTTFILLAIIFIVINVTIQFAPIQNIFENNKYLLYIFSTLKDLFTIITAFILVYKFVYYENKQLLNQNIISEQTIENNDEKRLNTVETAWVDFNKSLTEKNIDLSTFTVTFNTLLLKMGNPDIPPNTILNSDEYNKCCIFTNSASEINKQANILCKEYYLNKIIFNEIFNKYIEFHKKYSEKINKVLSFLDNYKTTFKESDHPELHSKIKNFHYCKNIEDLGRSIEFTQTKSG